MSKNYRSRAPLLWLVGPLIFGFVLADTFRQATSFLLVAAGCVGALAACLLATRKKNKSSSNFWPVIFLVSATCLAWGYYSHRLNLPPADWDFLPPREAELVLVTKRTFQLEDHYGRTTGIALIREAPRILKELEGQKVFFQLDPLAEEPSPVRSEVFRGRGILSFIGEKEGGETFGHYLNKTGTYFELRRGRILERVKKANWFYRFCQRQNDRFEGILRLGSREGNEWQNAYSAILLGKKTALTKEQKERYLASGTMHFFAISGLHVGAAAMALHYFFMLLRLPRAFSAWLGLGALFLYVQITGGTPSAIRAFLMVSFFWGSIAFTRSPAPFSALILSAIAVLLLNPAQLWNSGFQLSYAVVAAIILYGAPLGAKLTEYFRPFRGLPETSYRWHHRVISSGSGSLLELFGVSLAAGVMSSPLTIQYFQIFTPGAIFLNMALVPLVGLLVAGGFISIFFGLLSLTWLSAFFNHGAWLILWFLDALIAVSQELPGFFWRLNYTWRLTGPLAALVILGSMLLLHAKKRQEPSGLAFFVPPLLLFLVVIAGTSIIA